MLGTMSRLDRCCARIAADSPLANSAQRRQTRNAPHVQPDQPDRGPARHVKEEIVAHSWCSLVSPTRGQLRAQSQTCYPPLVQAEQPVAGLHGQLPHPLPADPRLAGLQVRYSIVAGTLQFVKGGRPLRTPADRGVNRGSTTVPSCSNTPTQVHATGPTLAHAW